MLKTRDGRPPQNGGKSVLIGCWFVQRSREGRPIAAGRIVKGVRAGEYLLAYISRDPDVLPLTPTATAEQMATNNFELWAHEANWRRAYAGADAPRGNDGQLQR
jgi:hypothetical protein